MTLTPEPRCGPAVITKTITILEPPTANAMAQFSNTTGCVPLTVTFDNQSTGYQVGYNWTISPAMGWAFAPGSTATSFEPSVKFTTAGDYIVTLTATNVCDTDTWKDTIEVKTTPTIQLPTLGPFCKTATLNFSSPSTQFNNGNGTISNYAWSFPGGTPSSSNQQYPTNILYNVTAATTFTASVAITNECGTVNASTSFEVQVPAALTMPPNQTLCINAVPIQLTATPSTGTWSGQGISPTGLFTPANAGGPGDKLLTYTYGNGVCQSVGATQITVVALPTVNAGSDLSPCVSVTSVTLGGTPTGGTWTGSGAISGGIFNPMQAGVGTYTLTYTYIDANGCSNTDTRTVTVQPLPVLTVSNATFCNAPGLVTLPAATPAGGTWSGPGITGSNQFDPILAGGVGTYTAVYTYTNPTTGCSNTANATITVVNPTAIEAGPNASACLNAPPINLSVGATPAGGNWTSTGGGLAGSIFTPSIAGPGMYTLTYTFGNGNCLVTDTRTITVFPLPVVSAGTDLSACVNVTSVDLGGTPAGGTWTGSFAINGTSFNPSLAGAGTVTLTYTFTDANGCINSDTRTVTVHPLPVVTTSNVTFCNTPGLVNLPAATPAGGVWSGTGVNGNQFNPITAGGVGTYTAVYTYTNPTTTCTNTASSTITVIDPVAINAGPDVSLCLNAPPVDLSVGATPPNGAWTSTGGGLAGSIFTPSVAGAGMYTLTYTFGNGNCLVTDTRTIVVFPLPVVSAGTDLSACVNVTSVDLGGTPAGGTWTGSFAINGTSFNPSLAGAGTVTLTYTFTDANGCINSDTRTVTVHPLPVVTTSNVTFCNTPGLVNLPAATPAGGVWSGTGVNGNQFNPITAGGVGTYTAVYTYTNPTTTCTNTASSTITVIDPVAINAGPDVSLCRNAPPIDLSMGATPPNGTWTSTGGGLSGSTFTPSVAGPGTYTITYSVGSGNCLVTDTQTITVWDLPTVSAGLDFEACIDGMAVPLIGTPVNGVWTSSGSGVVNGTSFDPGPSGEGTFTLTYTFKDTNGCVNDDELTAVVNPLPVVMSNDTTYCNTAGTVALPFGSPTGGSWNGQGITGNLFNPIAAGGVGSYPAVYTFADNNGCDDTDTINIAVINPDNVQAGPDTAFCVSITSFDLSASASPAGGTWTSSSNGLTGSTFNPSVAGAGTHTLNYSVGAGNCEVVDTRTIVVNALPVVVAGTDQSSCVDNNNVPLTGTPANGVWTSDGSGVVNGTSFDPSQSGEGTFTLTYTFTDNNGCVNDDELTVVVNPLPVVMSNDTTYCNTPGTVLLPFGSPVSGTWSGQGITGNLFNPIAAGGVGSYPAVYTFADNNGCDDTDTINIEVINPATVNAGVDSAFCESATSFDLNFDNTPAGGTWTSDGGGLTGSIFDPGAASPGVYTLTYSVGVGNCEVKDERTIEVWALPVVNAGADLSACVSDSVVSLGGTPGPGLWTVTSSGMVTDSLFFPSASGEGSFVLTYTHTDANGCVNNDSLAAVVHPLPVMAASDTTYCNTPGSVELPFSSPAGGTWTGAGITGSSFDPMTAGGVGTYPATYAFTDGNGCSNDTTVNISVIEPPVINAGVNDTLCINTGNLQLTGFVPASGGTWSGSGIVDAQNGVFDPTVAGGGTHTLTYTFGVGNCQVKDDKDLLVIAADIEAGPDFTACFDDNAQLLTGFMPAGGVWTGPGIIDPIGVFRAETAGVGTFVLVYQYNDPILDCVFTDSLSVTVHPMPESDFAEPTNSCINEIITFDNLSASTFMPLWNFGDGTTSTLAEPTHIYTDTGTYIVSLITENEFGCVDSISRSIFVTEPPTAYFTTMPDSGCAVLQVNFFNTSFGFETTYTWDFGNGQTSNQYDPGIIGFEQGTDDTLYYIRLTATNLCAQREWIDSVKVFPWPQVNFGTTFDTICTGETIAFSNITLGNPESFLWDFGNGVTSTDTFPPPVQFFTDTSYQTYTIQLIATNFCGSDTAVYPVVVKPSEVQAFFNVPNDTGCEPYTVTFTNFSTLGAQVSWDFGDGNTSADASPTHTFTAEGVYTVVQKVTSGCGYDSTIALITVLPAPDVSFTSEPQVCRNDSLSFTNTSQNLAGTTWFFGTADSSLLYNPAYAWAQAGTYPVTLVGISAENGCPATFTGNITVLELPVIAFTPTPLDGCVPLTVQFTNQSQNATYFDWNFGDGNTGTGTTVSHTYYDDGQFAVHLTGIDLNGCRNSDTLRYITAHPIPNAAFTLDRDRLCGVPVNVQTTNQTPDAVGYTWNFGNGGMSVLNDPATTYTMSGDYTVQLIAVNSFGCRDTVAQPFSAYDIPVADFTWTPEDGCAPLEVQFTNLSLFSTNAFWTISNGAVSTEFSPTQWFYTPGIYGATLIASHRDVCFDTFQLDDIIFVKPSPWANFTFVEIATTPPSGMFEFTDQSIDDVAWDWDFGDGSSSDEENPSHRYFSNGAKVVTLVVTSENGCTDDTSQVVTPTSMRGLFIPNAFTPGLNGDLASKFWPQGVGLKEYKIAVYSSFGQELWSSDKLNEGQPAEGWDGTYKDELLPQDVYVWKVITAVFEDGTVWEGNFDYGTGSGKKVGSVTLIR